MQKKSINIFSYLKIYQNYLGKKLYVIFIISLLVALSEGLGISMLLPLIQSSGSLNGNLSNSITAGIYSFLNFMGVTNLLIGTLVLTVIIFLIKGILKFIEGTYSGRLQSELLRRLTIRMFDSYNTIDYQYFTKQNTGHFINVLNVQIYNTVVILNHFLGFLTQLIMAVTLIGIAFFISLKISLFTVLAGSILMIVFRSLNARVSGISRKSSEELSVLNKFLIQTLQALKYIISTAQNDHLRKGVVKSVRLLTDYMYRLQIWRSITNAIQEPVSLILMVGIILVQVTYMNEPISSIVVALILFYKAMRTLMAMQQNWQQAMSTIGSIEMVEKEFKVTNDHRERGGNIVLDTRFENILFNNLSFSYDNQQKILDKLQLEIKANTTIAFAGESGAGKTTLVDLLTLLLKPTEGELTINGIPSEQIQLSSWRRQIGYVSQDTVVFDDTIANNICLWNGDYRNDPDIRKKVEEAARKAYADGFINQMPNGYETMVGERGVRVSGGQKQRLFIARELYKNPNLLILDEATSALDSESERYIQESIDNLKRSLTVVIIAHRLSTIKNADIIYVMDNGVIIESGSFEELTSKDHSRFSKMVNIQQI